MQKYGKSNTQNEIFFEVFWRGLVFNGMEMAFLYGLKPLARDNALYGADASVRARDKGEGMAGLGCRDRGRRGTRWHRGDGKKKGGRFFMVAAVLFALRCAIETATFLHIRDNKKMGLMGLMG